MRRALVAAALVALAAVPPAGAALRVKSVQTGGHPTVAVTVVASTKSARAPVLLENGRRVADADARNLADDKSIVVALDRSRSMAGEALSDATAAVRRFVAAKPATDRLAVHAFGSTALELTRFSLATIDADIALRDMAVDSEQGTALYDAIALGARRLADEKRSARILVVLTDGNDVSSTTSRQGAVRIARRGGVAVYPVAIESSQLSPGPLQAIAQATGGRYFGVSSTASLGDVYRALSDELERTWRIEYVSGLRPGDRGRVEVRMRGAGAATAPISIDGSRGRDEASQLIPPVLYDSALGTMLVAGAVGVLALIAAAVVGAARRGSWLSNRVAPHVKSYAQERGTPTQERAAIAAELFQATERSLGHLRLWRALERRLERADLALRVVHVVYISLGAAFLAGLVTAVAALPTLVIFGAMAVAGAVPTLVVNFKAKKRTKAFDEQLPDLLMTVAASLKAGHSFKQAIQTIVDEGEPPASLEFKRVVTELQLGRPMDEALADMTERVGSPNFSFVMTAVAIQRQVGGSLAGLFDTVAETVRDRQQFARKIRSLTAMGRGSAYILVALPFVLAIVLTLINPTYMSPLFTTSTGHMMIGIGLGSMTLGTLVLRKIVAFKG